MSAEVALVTGGASGLGRAITSRLHAAGMMVLVGDIDTTAAALAADELGGAAVELDVASEASWADAADRVRRSYGRLDVLVNSAGIFDPVLAADPERMSLDDWRRTMRVNLDGVFLGCRTSIPILRDSGGGSIVNIGSVAGSVASSYATAYGASKAAVLQLTRSVAQYCAQDGSGIRCNAVLPGVVATPQYTRRAEEVARLHGTSLGHEIDTVTTQTPLGELVAAEDVAALVAFLVSPDSTHTTGSSFVVDSGFLIRHG